jgi:hypothetical protein
VLLIRSAHDKFWATVEKNEQVPTYGLAQHDLNCRQRRLLFVAKSFSDNRKKEQVNKKLWPLFHGRFSLLGVPR